MRATSPSFLSTIAGRAAPVLALALTVSVSAAFTTGCGKSSSGSSGSSSSSSDLTFTPATGTVIPATAGPLAPGALPFSQTFTVVSGGTPPFTFTPITTPAGLSLSAAPINPGLVGTLSAILQGTPSQPGLEMFSMNVTDANQRVIAATWYIEVGQAALPLTVTPTTLPPGTRGQPYNVFLNVTGGVTPFSWTLTTGPLPPGIAFTPSTGVTAQLSGTPTTAGSFPFTITVVDGSTPARSLILNYTLTVP